MKRFNRDSVRGQGGAPAHPAQQGLSLRPDRIASHPHTGVLSADLRLKHLSADNTNALIRTPSRIRAHAATPTKNVVARQRVRGITP